MLLNKKDLNGKFRIKQNKNININHLIKNFKEPSAKPLFNSHSKK